MSTIVTISGTSRPDNYTAPCGAMVRDGGAPWTATV